MLVGKSVMAKACKIFPLQPSAGSRENLRQIESSLKRYSTSVDRVVAANAGIHWTPRPSSPARRFHRVSLDSQSQSQPVAHVVRTAEVITIDSDSDVDVENPASRDAIQHDEEVWADAYEYQEQMLLEPRLSQISTEADKENTAPSHGKQPTPESFTNRSSTYTHGFVGQSSKPDVPGPSKPGDDCFARHTQQYDDIPCPAAHRPLHAEEFFSMQNNPTSHGYPPTVIYVTNEKQLDSVIGLLQGPILSLDLEWLAWVKRTNISLIQISDAHTVLLIQISRFSTFPVKLKNMIEDPSIIKCGVAIMGADMSRLRDVYGVWARGVCELSFFARLVDRDAHGPKNTLISLSNLAYHYLGSHLAKGPVRCSDWNAMPLSSEQRQYAAIDAYSGYLIFAQLERQRQSKPEFRNIWPPVTACPPRKALYKASTAGTRGQPSAKSTTVKHIQNVVSKSNDANSIENQIEADTFMTTSKYTRRKVKPVATTNTSRHVRKF